MLNGYVKGRVAWLQLDGMLTIVDTILSVSSMENNQPENNYCDVTVPDFGDFYRNGMFAINEGDLVFVYAKTITDNSDIDITDDDVFWSGRFIDYKRKDSPDESTIQLKIGDITYNLFQRYDPSSYIGRGMKTNEVLIDVIKRASERWIGDGTFEVDFENISSKRVDNSDFPVIEPTYGTSKPIYEWVNELNMPLWTNSQAEQASGNLVHTRPMIFKVRGNKAFWYYPSTDTALTITPDTPVIELEASSTNEAVVNWLILDCGDDFNGRPIHHYIYDKRTSSFIKKERAEKKYAIAGRNTDYDNAYHFLRSQYTELTNNQFRARVRELAESYAETWFYLYSRSRVEIKVTLSYRPLYYGDLVRINVPKYLDRLWKVESVQHSLSQRAWTTSITLREFIERIY